MKKFFMTASLFVMSSVSAQIFDWVPVRRGLQPIMVVQYFGSIQGINHGSVRGQIENRCRETADRLTRDTYVDSYRVSVTEDGRSLFGRVWLGRCEVQFHGNPRGEYRSQYGFPDQRI